MSLGTPETLYLCNIDNLQKEAEYAPYFRLFYDLVCIQLSVISKIIANFIKFILAVEKYKIIGGNIYNFDKKNFMIGFGVTLARVISLEEIKSGDLIKIS